MFRARMFQALFTIMWSTVRESPFFTARRFIFSASETEVAIGFSTITCLPADRAVSAMAACDALLVAT